MLRLRTAWLVCMVAGACTKTNPAATCTDNGMCTDPSFPYCDIDGSVGGTPGACIAAPCVAGTFAKCDGSNALVCNATGEGYDNDPCVNGCADGSGCITCTPSTQTCTSGTQTNCDATGMLTTTTCPLGCSTDGSACAIYVPSNDLETYIDMTAAPQDLDLEDGTLELDASTFTNTAGTMTMTIPSFDVAAPTGGAPVRVFVVNKLTLGDITITSATAVGGVGRAAAFLAIADVAVIGTVEVQSGALARSGCTGGMSTIDAASSPPFASGGGGGGNANAGGSGGAIVGGAAGGVGGGPSGTGSMVPLVGGCPGGGGGALLGGSGGGALQLMSRTSIDVSGTITVDGSGRLQFGGGGAGGGILMEGPSVIVSGTALLLARGGGGAAGNQASPVGQLNGSPLAGGTCSPVSVDCSNGGNGAATADATNGVNLALPSSGTNTVRAGGGGGGLGRIRVNTADGTFTPAGSAILVGSTTNGPMLTN